MDDQAVVAVLTQKQLADLLQLPEGHTVERIALDDIQYRPGLLVVISGPKMPLHRAHDPLCITSWENVREWLDRDG